MNASEAVAGAAPDSQNATQRPRGSVQHTLDGLADGSAASTYLKVRFALRCADLP